MLDSTQLAKEYEYKAQTTKNKTEKITYMKEAITIYKKLGLTSDETRCLKLVSNLVEGTEKIGFLVECWKAHIKEILVYKYETSYEWKGEVDNLSDDYALVINNSLADATETLREILRIPGVDRDSLLEVLAIECANQQSIGGWSSEECWKSIDDAWKK